MSAVINTNIASLNAQRNLSASQSALSTSLQRLSSGLRINSAKDDAAGLAISERFSSQINGLNQAARNANDGISLAQTGEAALGEITSNLQRIRELAVQSANSTNSASDRLAIDQEVQQLLAEIDRTSTQTSFNGQKILDGSFGNATFQVGANAGETIGLTLSTSTRTNAIGGIASTTGTVDLDSVFSTTGLVVGSGELTIQFGSGTAVDVAAATYTTAADLATAINTAANTAAGTSGTTYATVSSGELVFSNSGASAFTIAGDDAATIGLTTVAAATGSNGADAIAAGDIDDVTMFEVTADDLTVAVDGGSAVSVAAGIYTGAELAAAINVATGGSEAAFAGGTITITGTADGGGGGGTIFAGDLATDLGLGTIAAAATDTVDTTDTGIFDQTGYTVSDLTVKVGAGAATAVTTGTYTQTELIDAINTAATTSAGSATTVASDDGSGGITITNTSTTDTITFGGATDSAALLGTQDTVVAVSTVAAGTATSTGVATAVAASSDTTLTLASGQFTLAVGDLDAASVTGTFASSAALATAVNNQINGVYASVDSNGYLNIQSSDALTLATSDTTLTTLGLTAGETATSGDLDGISVQTAADANETILRIDSALSSVSTLRGTYGAIQNRFESVIASLSTASENLSAARSRIQDADFAAETAALTRSQILQQAGTAMLAQANQLPNTVLSLLQ